VICGGSIVAAGTPAELKDRVAHRRSSRSKPSARATR
jgi:hypothetical protein